MFVSSYNTYIHTNSAQKSTKSSSENTQNDSKLFATKLAQHATSKSLQNSAKPINYVKEQNASYNKELLQSKEKSFIDEFRKTTASTQKYNTFFTLNSAKNAYAENTTLFSLFRKAQTTLDQTPRIDKDIPQNIQELKEQNIRHTMVNTYIENDKYYQITA